MNTTTVSNSSAANAVSGGHHDQSELKQFGFWVYLMTDLILFSALFATFAAIGFNYAGGKTGKELFDLPYLFVETMFLLVSSMVFGFAMVAMHAGKKNLTLIGIILTFVLGLGFVGMEIHEFGEMIAQGAGPDRSGFLSAFFALVGCHGLHVSIGLLWMIVMAVQVVKKGFTTGVTSRMMRLSLFWHFLDIVWVGVFSFVYLLGMI